MDEAKAAEEAIKAQRKYFAELRKLAQSDDVQKLFERDMRVAIDKMLWTFTGNNVKTWEDFTAVKGEVASLLARIQEVNGAEVFEKKLQAQLKEYYGG